MSVRGHAPPKDQAGDRQLPLLEAEKYLYRVFVTNVPGRPHTVIADYDQRASGS